MGEMDAFNSAGIGQAVIFNTNERTKMNAKEITKQIEDYGFKVWHTGGGCTAWHRVVGDHTYILITDKDGSSHEVGSKDDLMIAMYEHFTDEEAHLFNIDFDDLGKFCK